MKNKKNLLSLFLLLALAIPSFSNAFYNIQPADENPTMKFEIEAGGNKTAYINVRNASDEDINVLLYPVDGTTSSSGSFAAKLPSQEQTGLGLWAIFDQSKFKIEANSKIKVNYDINIPSNTPPGTYSGGIAIQKTNGDDENKQNTGTSVNIVQRNITAFFVNVPGKKQNAIDFKSFTHQKNSDGTIDFIFNVENTGNTALTVNPKVKLRDKFGLFSKEIEGREINLYLGNETKFDITLENPPLLGLIEATAELSYSENDIVLGRTILIDKKILTQTIYIIPWFIIFAILIIIVAVLSFVIIRSLNHKNLIKNSEKHIVQEGESLNKIANNYMVDWKKIVKINKLKPPYEVHTNQEILIPVNEKK
jgi:LysM repeat protein